MKTYETNPYAWFDADQVKEALKEYHVHQYMENCILPINKRHKYAQRLMHDTKLMKMDGPK